MPEGFPREYFPFEYLPDDLKRHVESFCTPRDLMSLAVLCKQMYALKVISRSKEASEVFQWLVCLLKPEDKKEERIIKFLQLKATKLPDLENLGVLMQHPGYYTLLRNEVIEQLSALSDQRLMSLQIDRGEQGDCSFFGSTLQIAWIYGLYPKKHKLKRCESVYFSGFGPSFDNVLKKRFPDTIKDLFKLGAIDQGKEVIQRCVSVADTAFAHESAAIEYLERVHSHILSSLNSSFIKVPKVYAREVINASFSVVERIQQTHSYQEGKCTQKTDGMLKSEVGALVGLGEKQDLEEGVRVARMITKGKDLDGACAPLIGALMQTGDKHALQEAFSLAHLIEDKALQEKLVEEIRDLQASLSEEPSPKRACLSL